ncbi:MAG: exo-alpha-sialidase [Chloroflexaceae bacterium]|nr:exo-alpha-sialidase [Chloroflexaceae bacterium]
MRFRFKQQHLLLQPALVLTGILLGLLLLAAQQPIGHHPIAPVAAVGTWSQEERLTSTSVDSIKPDVVIDTEGVSHIVYQETNFSSLHRVYYRHNRTGSWSIPLQLSGDSSFDPAISTIAVDGRISIDVVYGSNEHLFYRRSTDAGRTWQPEQQVTDHASFQPAIVIDDQAQPHIGYTRGGKLDGFDILDIYYTTLEGAAWTEPIRVGNTQRERVNGETVMTFSRDAQNQRVLHLLYRAQPNFNFNDPRDIKVYAFRKPGDGSWGRQTLTAYSAAKPHVVSDYRSDIYAVSITNEDPYSAEPFFFRSTDNGKTWSEGRAVGTQTEKNDLEGAIARTPSGMLAVVYAANHISSRNKSDIYARFSTNDGASWGEEQIVFDAPGLSAEPAVAGGVNGFRAIWNDNNTGRLRIFTSWYDLAAPEPQPTDFPGPTATTQPADPTVNMELIGTQENLITAPLVNLQFTLLSGNADRYRLSNDGQTWSALQTLPPDGLVTGWPIAEAPTAACTTHTIYGQVQDSQANLLSPVFTLDFTYDPGVAAQVLVRNPYLSSNAVLPDDAATTDGALDGDHGYTRSDTYYAQVRALPGECSGLAEVAFETLTLVGNDLADGLLERVIALSQVNPTDGAYQVEVGITDGSGQTQSYGTDGSLTIIRDTVAPQLTAPSDALQVTSNDGLTVTDSVLVQLRMQGVAITDNLYGQQPDEPYPFWGLFVANARDCPPVTDTVALRNLTWLALPVTNATLDDGRYVFHVSWSLLSGLTALEQTTGAYCVYARVLDGAGNPSTTVLQSNRITLTDGFRQPAVYLPLVRR